MKFTLDCNDLAFVPPRRSRNYRVLVCADRFALFDGDELVGACSVNVEQEGASKLSRSAGECLYRLSRACSGTIAFESTILREPILGVRANVIVGYAETPSLRCGVELGTIVIAGSFPIDISDDDARTLADAQLNERKPPKHSKPVKPRTKAGWIKFAFSLRLEGRIWSEIQSQLASLNGPRWCRQRLRALVKNRFRKAFDSDLAAAKAVELRRLHRMSWLDIAKALPSYGFCHAAEHVWTHKSVAKLVRDRFPVDQSTSNIIAHAVELRKKSMTWQQVTLELARMGFESKRGGSLSPPYVRQLVESRLGKQPKFINARPYGLKTNGRPDPDEMRVIDRMIQLRKQGLSYEKIASQINAEGLRSRTGKPWERTKVCEIILRKDRTIEGRNHQAYGVNRDGSPNEQELEAIELIVQWALAGDGSRKIAKRLNELNIPSRFGSIWRSDAIARIIKRDSRVSAKQVNHQPYGMNVDGSPNEQEQRNIEVILNLWNNGVTNQTEIVRRLEELNVLNRAGNSKWDRGTVLRILRRAAVK